MPRLPSLPPPTSFAEGQRLVFGCLVAAAGMFCGAMAIGMIALLMWGGWDKAEQHTIVLIFGWSLGGFIAAMSMVIVGLMVGGPVGRFKSELGRGGATFEASGPGEASPQTVAAAASGAAAGAVAAASGAAPATPPPIKPGGE